MFARTTRIAPILTVSLLISCVSPESSTDEAEVTAAAAIAAIKTAYDVYQRFHSSQLTLEEAKAQLVEAIQVAALDIKAHFENIIAAVELEACATSAVTDVTDLQALSPDTLQAFARDTTLCADRAKAFIAVASDQAALDKAGFALDTVGPIALLARRAAGLTTALLTSTLVAGNESLIARLRPSCIGRPLWGDATPGSLVEVQLKCTAYNGRRGFDFVLLPLVRGQPLPEFDFTEATRKAMEGTSREAALAVLPPLRAL